MFNLIFTCLACAGLAFGANNIDKVQYQSNDNVVFHQELKRNATCNDESYTITLSVDELNNYQWVNLRNYLQNLLDNDGVMAFDNVTYNNVNIQDIDSYMFFVVDSSDNGYGIIFPNENTDSLLDGITYDNYINYILMTDGGNDIDRVLFEYDLTINLTSTYYDAVKTAIQADILANQPANDNYAGALGDFVSIMVAGLQNFGAGVANGLVTFASALFLATDSGGNVTGLSIFGGIIAIFAGLALAVGITTRVYLWVTSLGK